MKSIHIVYPTNIRFFSSYPCTALQIIPYGILSTGSSPHRIVSQSGPKIVYFYFLAGMVLDVPAPTFPAPMYFFLNIMTSNLNIKTFKIYIGGGKLFISPLTGFNEFGQH